MPSPTLVAYYPPTPLFVARVTVDPDTGCWNWTGATRRSGDTIPHLTYKRRLYLGRRWAWTLTHGRETPHMLRSVCRNPLCVQPAHHEEVKREPKCRTGGHPMTGANLYVDPQGKRKCRTCTAERLRGPKHRAAQRAWHARMSEEQKERARERARAQAARVRVARRVGKNIMWCPDVGRWLIRDGERWIRG